MSAMPDLSPATLDPLRRRRRLLWVGGLLIVLALLLRLGWGAIVARQLANDNAALAPDEPTEFAQLASPPLDDAANAWVLQDQAARAIAPNVYCPSESTLSYNEYLPYPPEWMKLATASEKANRQLFSLARQARSRPLGQAPRLKPPYTNFPHILSSRQLANHLGDGAVLSHLQGNDAEAIERIRDTFHLARSLQNEDDFIAQLTAIGIDGLAIARASVIAPGLRFKPANGVRPATREQVRALIAEMLDEHMLREQLTKMYWRERLLSAQSLKSDTRAGWALWPLLANDTLRYRAVMAQAARAIQKTNLTEALIGIPTWESEKTGANRPSRWFTRQFGFENGIVTFFRVFAERRMIAVSLAIQLYREDEGHWPATLDELVPKYLAAVPRDPLPKEEKLIGYLVLKGVLPGGGDRPLVFTEPPDMNRPDFVPQEPVYSYWNDMRGSGQTRSVARQYRDVSRWAPPSLPKAVDDNP
jgi:hypothetical protein